jgi:DNA-binding MarR family transcriptional regulator
MPENLLIRSPKLHLLTILRELGTDPNLAQAELARRCDLSVAMVNNYMKDLAAAGLVEYRRKSSRVVSYHVTDLGRRRLRSLQQDWLVEMVRLFEEAKSAILKRVLERDPAPRRVILFGEGHLAEIVFHALESSEIQVIGVCRDDPTTIGREWCGRTILSPSQIRYMAPDAVIIVDPDHSDQIHVRLAYLRERGIRLIRLDSEPDDSAAPRPRAMNETSERRFSLVPRES